MRTVTYYVATSVDGFIARPDGSFDGFLVEGEHIADYVRRFPETFPGHLRAPLGVTGEAARFDTVLMGRRTYEVGTRMGIASPYPHLRQVVYSTSLEATAPDVELVATDPLDHVHQLKAQAGRGIWLCGGGALAAAIFPAIDELILKVNPVIFGAGLPVVAGGIPVTALDLTEQHAYGNGVLLLRYRVEHGALE